MRCRFRNYPHTCHRSSHLYVAHKRETRLIIRIVKRSNEKSVGFLVFCGEFLVAVWGVWYHMGMYSTCTLVVSILKPVLNSENSFPLGQGYIPLPTLLPTTQLPTNISNSSLEFIDESRFWYIGAVYPLPPVYHLGLKPKTTIIIPDSNDFRACSAVYCNFKKCRLPFGTRAHVRQWSCVYVHLHVQEYTCKYTLWVLF